MPFIAIALAVAATLGGGTALVAQNSLPGDALWGFKVHVNEEVRGALTADAEAKANWDISVLESRLEEAQKLSADAKLTADIQAKIAQNFEAHAQSVAQIVADLEAKGETEAAADIAARFQATIAQHISTLAEVNANAGTEIRATMSPLLLQVRGTLDEASDLSAQVSAKAAAKGFASSSAHASSGHATSSSHAHVEGSSTIKVESNGSNASGTAEGTLNIGL